MFEVRLKDPLNALSELEAPFLTHIRPDQTVILVRDTETFIGRLLCRDHDIRWFKCGLSGRITFLTNDQWSRAYIIFHGDYVIADIRERG